MPFSTDQNHILHFFTPLSTTNSHAFFFTNTPDPAKILQLMAGKIKINTERCKGCGLCVAVCPKECLVISNKSNAKGYFPAEAKDSDCTACAACALICPDVVIEVYLADDIVDIETKRGKKPTLVRDKTG